MKCIHHNDDDGLCAAAIVRFYLKDKVYCLFFCSKYKESEMIIWLN